VRSRKIDLMQLYQRDGPYSYARGVNVNAVIALAFGWGVAALGLVKPLHLYFLWQGGWVFGIVGGLVAYAALMRLRAAPVAPQQDAEAATAIPAAAAPVAKP